MKKIKALFVALSSTALLSSCGAVKWQEFSYKRKLETNEKLSLVAKVQSATFARLNKLEEERTSDSADNLSSIKTQDKHVWNFYQKGEFDSVRSYKEVKKVANKESKIEYTTKCQYALYDEENLKYALASIEGSTGEYSYLEEVLEDGDQEKGFMSEAGSAFMHLTSTGSDEMKAYEDNKGNFFFLFSDEQETNQLVDYGNSKKNFHKIEKVQRVALLNQDLSLKSMSYILTVEQNRDPSTNEFYKKTKVVQNDTWTAKFSYGDKADGSSELGELRQKAKEGYSLVATPNISLKAYKEDGTELGSAGLAIVDSKRVDFGKHHYVAKIEGIDPTGISSLKLFVKGQSCTNAKPDLVDYDKEAAIGSLVAGNSGLTLAGGAIKVGENECDVTVEFDIEATAEGATISNVAAYAAL